MRIFTLSNSITTDRPTNQPTDGRTDKASYRDAWTHLKSREFMGWAEVKIWILLGNKKKKARNEGKEQKNHGFEPK